MKFDWVTFGLQLANVLILLAILRHFLFRPVAAIIAQRQAQAQAALDDAAKACAAAEAAEAKATAEANATAAARADVLARAATEAEAARAATLDRARAEAARIVADGQAARAADTATAEARALDRARDLAGAIAARALAAQPDGIAGYAARLRDALAALPETERASLLAGPNLRLVSARPLTDADRAALDGLPTAVETDPALIAGLDLRSDTGVLRNSLAHDLDQIGQAMRDA